MHASWSCFELTCAMLFRIISSVVKNCYYEIIGVLVLTRFRFHSFQNAPFQFFMPSFQVKGCHPIDLLLKPSLIKLTPKSKHRVQRTRLFGSLAWKVVYTFTSLTSLSPSYSNSLKATHPESYQVLMDTRNCR